MEGELLKWAEYQKEWEKVYCVINKNHLSLHCSKDDHISGSDPTVLLDLEQCDISEKCFKSNQFVLTDYLNSNFLVLRSQSEDNAESWVKLIESITDRKASLSRATSSKIRKRLSIRSEKSSKSKIEKRENQHQEQNDSPAKSKFDEVCAKLSSAKSKVKNIHDEIKPHKRRFGSKAKHTNTKTKQPPESSQTLDCKDLKCKTFYSLSTFAPVKDSIRVSENDPLFCSFDAFIKACTEFMTLFDRHNSTVLIPIKLDMQLGISNLKKNKELSKCPTDSLLAEVLDEVDEGKTQSIDSSAFNLLWLLRTIKTMNIFSTNLIDTQSPSFRNTHDSFLDAYNKVLLKHHNWIFQKMFRAGLKLVPSYEHIVKSLIEPMYSTLSFEEMENLLSVECLQYTDDVEYVVNELANYLSSIGLEL